MATRAASPSSGSLDSDCWKTFAVPWKLPWMLVGMWIAAAASSMARVASLSDFPVARVDEMVVAGSVFWWFTEVGVAPSAQWAKADSGVISSGVVLTATPWEAARPGGAAGP